MLIDAGKSARALCKALCEIGEDIENINAAVEKYFDLRPQAIINKFDLRRPIYTELSSYGQMGREELDCPWEDTSVAAELKSFVQGK